MARVLHALSIGAWAGVCLLFNGCVALKTFAYFRGLVDHPTPGLGGISREVASRMAGDLLATIFPVYFVLQIVLGLLATVTVWGVGAHLCRTARWRRWLVTATFVIVAVHHQTLYKQSTVIRAQQYAALDAGQSDEAERLRKAFFQLHGPSLVIDLTTSVLVLVSLGSLGVLIPPANRADPKVESPTLLG